MYLEADVDRGADYRPPGERSDTSLAATGAEVPDGEHVDGG